MKLFSAGDFGLIWKPYAVATLHVLAFPVSFENSRKLLKSFSFLGQGYGESLSSKFQYAPICLVEICWVCLCYNKLVW